MTQTVGGHAASSQLSWCSSSRTDASSGGNGEMVGLGKPVIHGALGQRHSLALHSRREPIFLGPTKPSSYHPLLLLSATHHATCSPSDVFIPSISDTLPHHSFRHVSTTRAGFNQHHHHHHLQISSFFDLALCHIPFSRELNLLRCDTESVDVLGMVGRLTPTLALSAAASWLLPPPPLGRPASQRGRGRDDASLQSNHHFELATRLSSRLRRLAPIKGLCCSSIQ